MTSRRLSPFEVRAAVKSASCAMAVLVVMVHLPLLKEMPSPGNKFSPQRVASVTRQTLA